MIKIFIWTIFALPAALAWLAPWLSLVGSLLFWALAGLLLRFVVYRLIRWLVRRTESDIDDVILETSRTPAWLLLVLGGLYLTLPGLGLPRALVDPVEQAIGVGCIAATVYWVWRLFKDVVMYYAKRIVDNTETSLDDVLLPIVNQLGPLVIGMGGLLLALEFLGVRLESLLVAVGGISFILAFALQDILSNIFSGLSLVVDTPFAYRDLIVLADGTVCEVRHIGLRVTELYNVNSHSIIYVPNSQLANERLVNMTRPSPDLIELAAGERGPDGRFAARGRDPDVDCVWPSRCAGRPGNEAGAPAGLPVAGVRRGQASQWPRAPDGGAADQHEADGDPEADRPAGGDDPAAGKRRADGGGS